MKLKKKNTYYKISIYYLIFFSLVFLFKVFKKSFSSLLISLESIILLIVLIAVNIPNNSNIVNENYIISNNVYQSFDEALFAVIVYKYSEKENTYLLMESIGMKPNNYEINVAKGYIKNEKT